MNDIDINTAATSFMTPLRSGQGFDDKAYRELKIALNTFHEKWSASDTIPKTDVVTLIDQPRMVESCASLYSDAEQEQIINASHELVDVILSGF